MKIVDLMFQIPMNCDFCQKKTEFIHEEKYLFGSWRLHFLCNEHRMKFERYEFIKNIDKDEGMKEFIAKI